MLEFHKNIILFQSGTYTNFFTLYLRGLLIYILHVNGRGITMVAVAQLVRAPDCGSGGRGFETHQPPI